MVWAAEHRASNYEDLVKAWTPEEQNPFTSVAVHNSSSQNVHRGSIALQCLPLEVATKLEAR